MFYYSTFHHLGYLHLYVAASRDSISDQVKLLPCNDLDHSALHSLRDYEQVADNSEALQAVEASVSAWIKQIRHVGNTRTTLHLGSKFCRCVGSRMSVSTHRFTVGVSEV